MLILSSLTCEVPLLDTSSLSQISLADLQLEILLYSFLSKAQFKQFIARALI